MRLTVALTVVAGLQLAAAVKPPGFPHGRPGRPFHPHHRPPLPPGPPYPRYPPPGPQGEFGPRPYGPAAQIRPYSRPYPPPPPPRVSPRPIAATTTAAPSAETEPETVAPSLITVASSTTASPQAAVDTDNSVYFSTATHVTETTSEDAEAGEAVAEAPPTIKSKPEPAAAESEVKDVPKSSSRPRPVHRHVPHLAARPPYHPRPHPVHPPRPHHAPFPGGHRGPAPNFHHRPAPYPPRGHSKPKTYYVSGKRPSPPTTPVALVTTAATEPELPVSEVTEPASVPTQAPEVYTSGPATSAAPTYTTAAAAALPPSTSAVYTSRPVPTQDPTTTVRSESEPTTPVYRVPAAPVYSETPSVAAQTVPSYPTPPVPSQSPSPGPVYQLSFGTSSDAGDSSSGIPGVANVDYPTLSKVPETSFTCSDKIPGYYADQEASCQVWHYCGQGVSRQSFLCPVGTVYSQTTRVCDWWFNVNCAAAESQYGINADLYQPAPAEAAISYGQRRSAGPVGPLAPQPYSQGPHKYHALPQPDGE